MTGATATRTEAQAAIVTERAWERETFASKAARKGRRTNVPEPVFEAAFSRTGHYSETCPEAQGLPVVARNVRMDSADAGFPCEYCEPGGLFSDPVVADAFNRFDARQAPQFRSAPAVAGPRSEPTEKQMAFLRKLHAEKISTQDGSFEAYVEAFGPLTKSKVSTLIDSLVQAPRLETPAPAPQAQQVPAGVEIQNRANKYGGSCVLCGGHVADGAGRLGKQNGRWIVAHNDGECQAQVETPAAPAAPADGYEPKRGDVHVVDGSFYRVHIGQRSGHPYAVKAIVHSEAVRDADGTLQVPGEVEWDLARGMLRNLNESTRATAEQAHAFGALVGRCCFCSTKIDTPESTVAGYGPVCAAKYDLPWGDTTQKTES